VVEAERLVKNRQEFASGIRKFPEEGEFVMVAYLPSEFFGWNEIGR